MYIDNTCKTGSFNYNNSYYMANGVGPYDNNWYAGVQSGYTLVEMEVRILFCLGVCSSRWLLHRSTTTRSKPARTRMLAVPL